MELPIRAEQGNDVLSRVRRKVKHPANGMNNDVDFGKFSKLHVVTPREHVNVEEVPNMLTRDDLRSSRYKTVPEFENRLLSSEEAQQKVIERMKQYSRRRSRKRRDENVTSSIPAQINARIKALDEVVKKEKRRSGNKTSRETNETSVDDSPAQHKHVHEHRNNAHGSNGRKSRSRPEKQNPPDPELHISCPVFNTPSMGMLAMSGGEPKRRSLPPVFPDTSSPPELLDRKKLNGNVTMKSREKEFTKSILSKKQMYRNIDEFRRSRPLPPPAPSKGRKTERRSREESRQYVPSLNPSPVEDNRWSAVNAEKARHRPSSPQDVVEEYDDDLSTAYTMDIPSVVFSGGMSVVSELESYSSPTIIEAINAAITIQAFWRMVWARAKFIEELTEDVLRLQHYAATVIQSAVRGMQSREALFEDRWGASKNIDFDADDISLDFKTLYTPMPEKDTDHKCPLQRSDRDSSEEPDSSSYTVETEKSTLSESVGEEIPRNAGASNELLSSSMISDSVGVDDNELHICLADFEAARQKNFEPSLTSSCSQWYSAVEGLQNCVRETTLAERVTFELLAEYHDINVEEDGKGDSRFPFFGGMKRNTIPDAMEVPMHACLDIANEVSEDLEELQSQVHTLNELGDASIAELGSSEMAIVQAWDAYSGAVQEADKRWPAPCTTPRQGASNDRMHMSDNVADLWLLEMKYRILVSFQLLAWQKAAAVLSTIIESATKIVHKHRTRLGKLLLAFDSQQSLLEDASISTATRHTKIGILTGQIKELARKLADQTRRRPSVARSLSCLNLGRTKTQMLESPMASDRVHAAKVIEKKSKGSVGLRTYWNEKLAVLTENGFLHLFNRVPSSNSNVKRPSKVFIELVEAEYNDVSNGKGVHGHLIPVESIFLPNCTVDVNTKDARRFDIVQDQVGRNGNITTVRSVFRTESLSETSAWVEALHGRRNPT